MFVIKHNNGTYFKQWTGIGPCFGADLDEALRFDTKREADLTHGKHFGFIMSEVLSLKDAKQKETL